MDPAELEKTLQSAAPHKERHSQSQRGLSESALARRSEQQVSGAMEKVLCQLTGISCSFRSGCSVVKGVSVTSGLSTASLVGLWDVKHPKQELWSSAKYMGEEETSE